MVLKLKEKLFNKKTLLLLGGVFSIALAAWAWSTYRIVAEPDPRRFADADLVVTLFGDRPPVTAFIRKIAEAASATVDTASLTPASAVTFSAASSTIAFQGVDLRPSRLRIITRSVDGIGFARLPGAQHSEPVEISLTGDRLVARVGRGFTGIDLPTGAMRQGQVLNSAPTDAIFYYFDSRHSKKDLPSFPVSDLLKTLPVETEVIARAADSGPMKTFVLHASPFEAAPIDFAAVDGALKRLAGNLYPVKDKIMLPDQTESVEERNSFSGIRVDERTIVTGKIKKFTTPQGNMAFIYFEDLYGDLWLSNSFADLMGVTSKSISVQEPALKKAICIPRNASASFVIYPQTHIPNGMDGGLIDKLKTLFKQQLYLLKNPETGLFTFCGYL